MLKEKRIFHTDTNRYTVSTYSGKESRILEENLNVFKKCKNIYFNLIKNEDSPIEEIRENNAKLLKATENLANIGVDMNVKPYLIL
uniref:Uncharacterized protein n=1 Tax=Geladintestivirus 1 TaxID=3233133 RepID=A0AAU8MK87_9CAUD